ncbi:hypothetical protein [Phaeobacter sp. JH204B]|uniref:hypothetical protein n=1 Tax=Phaeobacter sp. JH204B TaxID=3112503 RepID=UPI003A88A706
MSAPDFVHHARAETMLKDFARLRMAIRTEHDIEAAERALDDCERWFDCINPNPKTAALQDEVDRLREALGRAARHSDAIRGAVETNQVADKDVRGTAIMIRDYCRAALAKEDT